MFYVLVTWCIYIFVLDRPPMVRVWALKQKTMSDTVHGNLLTTLDLGEEEIGSLCKCLFIDNKSPKFILKA